MTKRVCGCMGCRRPAVLTIEHDRHGQRAVCEPHAKGHKVIGYV